MQKKTERQPHLNSGKNRFFVALQWLRSKNMTMKFDPVTFVRQQLQLDYNLKSLSLFRIGLGLWVAWQSLMRLIFFEELYSQQGLAPFDSMVTFLSLTNYDGFPHLPWTWIAADGFGLLLLVIQFVLALCFAAGVLFPFVGWALCFLWWQLYYRSLIFSNLGDVIIFYALFWSIFLPLTKHFVLRPNLNSPRYFKQLESPFVVQFSVMFFFFFMNHTHGPWNEGTAIARWMADVSSQVLPEAATLVTYVLPWIELVIAIGVLFRRTRNYTLLILVVYILILMIFLQQFYIPIALLISAIALLNIRSSEQPATGTEPKPLKVIEVYLMILMIVPSFAHIEAVRFANRSLPVQMSDFLRRYFFLQRWNYLALPPSQPADIQINGQTVAEHDLMSLKDEHQSLETIFYTVVNQAGRISYRAIYAKPLEPAVRNFFCRFSRYPFSTGTPIQFSVKQDSRVNQFEFQCP